jgi:hypothetical protein
MKRFITGIAVFALMSGMAFAAEDGAALFKAKCRCVTARLVKVSQVPALKGTSLTAAQVADVLTNGAPGKKAPHGKALSGLTADQVTAVAAFVKSLK